MGVAVSPAKAKAIIGAVRAKPFNAVVTDVATAEAIPSELQTGKSRKTKGDFR
ncbi:hypothetical protein [Labrys sp. KNU-23]|uniref:hypothetical protein n=1 Tax=Labrys sp. KNU-23 TaxID=2789216 RepID=UPI00352A52F1